MATDKKNLDFQNMSENEEMTVTLTLEDGSDLECVVLTIFEAGDHDYIALLPLDGKEAEEGEEISFNVTVNGNTSTRYCSISSCVRSEVLSVTILIFDIRVPLF